MNFYEYLRSQFNDIESCKTWYRKWAMEWEQQIPDHPEWPVSMRAMAAHCSNVLVGVDEDTDGSWCTNYLSTKYGPEIYWG